MGTFTDQVRNSKIRQPTQLNFEPAIWRERYYSCLDHDPGDVEIFDAGLILHDRLQHIRDNLKQGRFHLTKRSDRLIAICAMMNYEVAVFDRNMQQKRTANKLSLKLPSLIDEKVTLYTGIQVTPDELLTAVLDSTVYPLDEALRASDDGEPLGQDLGSVGLAYVLANLYRDASQLWLRCVWGQIWLDSSSQGLIIAKSKDPRKARQQAVSEYLYRVHSITLTRYFSSMWRTTWKIKEKQALAIDKGVIEYDPKHSKPFVVGKLDWHRKRNIPASTLQWLLATEEYLHPFTRLILPKYTGLTVETIYRVWQVLLTLVDSVLTQVPRRPAGLDEVSAFEWLLAHAVRVTRAQIQDVLLRATSLEISHVDAAINFLTYQSRTDGLWQKPLIPLGNGEFLIAAIPFRYGNMLRIGERWLRQGGYDLKRRGPVFEELARKRIAEYLSESRLLNDAQVAPQPLFVGPDKEEIDLLVRVGNVVLVGEAKCQLFPVDSAESYRFQRRLHDGAIQAARKATAVQNHLNDVRNPLGIRSEQITVVPFVLSNSVLGSGYPINDVGVVDLVYLDLLLREGQGPGSKDRYYNNQTEAEKRIPNLLSRPPIARRLEPFIREQRRPLLQGYAHMNMFYDYHYVSLNMDLSPVDYENATVAGAEAVASS